MSFDAMKRRTRLWLRGLMSNENLWFKKVIPAGVRHLVSRPLEKQVLKQTRVPAPYVPGRYPPGINLYGLFKAEIGLSEGVKLYARALEEGGIPHRLLDLDFMPFLRQEDQSFDGRLTIENQYAINVVHINPPQWLDALGTFPIKQFDGHYNIAVILWELEQFPAEWRMIFDYVDEVWAPSAFIAEAVKKATDKPVTLIPYGMETPYDEGLTRADFGLADDEFLVLMMFDSRSYASRKNPGAAIDAFREAFGERPEKVRLVIKINNPTEEDIAFVEAHTGGSAYTLITERMVKQRLNSLIRLCDVFLSLHRAEGFGLAMAEAMALGTPAVATGWSANAEFMPEEVSCPVRCTLVPVNGAYPSAGEDSRWAEPDSHHAAEILRRLKEDPAYYREKAEAGQQYIREKLSLQRCAEGMRRRMEEILRDGKAEERA